MKDLNADVWSQTIEADQNAVVLDVRTPRECAEGILPGAKVLDYLNEDAFMYGLEELDNNKTYYVYCRSGNRSHGACRIMEERGFNVVNLQGGLIALSSLRSA